VRVDRQLVHALEISRELIVVLRRVGRTTDRVITATALV
jgi:hypothetical protein